MMVEMDHAPTIPVRARGDGRRFVAVLPGQSPELAPAVAAALGIDRYGAAQLLRRPVPAVVPFDDEAAARGAEDALAAAGVRTVAFDQATVDRVPDARPIAVVHVSGGGDRGGPYRDGGRAEVSAVDDAGVEERLACDELALVVVGRLETERIEDVDRQELVTYSRNGATERRVRHVKERELRATEVIDLYPRRGGPLRLVEGHTIVDGLGVRRYEGRAAFLRLRDWLAAPALGLAIDDGWTHERLRAEMRSQDGRVVVRDTTGGWDEWSARTWVIRARCRTYR
jgi:hypothetical protein